NMNRARIFVFLEKQMLATTRSEGADPVRMRNLARLAFCHDEIVAGHGSPGNIGRARASPAIDAMTIVHGKRPTLQHVSCPAANASTGQLHKNCSTRKLSRLHSVLCFLAIRALFVPVAR